MLTRESYCDRPTWSPAPYNEIAYAARTGPGFDIKVLDLATRRAPAVDVRRGQQREPGVRAQRPPPRVQLDARGQAPALHDRSHGQGRAATDEGRQQPDAGLVEVATRRRAHATARGARSAPSSSRHSSSLSAGACHQERAAGRRPAPSRRRRDPAAVAAAPGKPPAPPEPVKEPSVAAPAPIVEDQVQLGARSTRSTRTRRSSRCSSTTTARTISAEAQKVARRERRRAEEEPDVGRSRSKGTATSAARPSTTSRSASAAPCAARTYLVSLGIPADRLRTVSYGKEFPFDPGHDEAAWAKNRRAHFVVTQK